MKKNEIIIAFTTRTGKFLPRLLCKNFKHCCVIIKKESAQGATYILVQIAADGVRLVPMGIGDLARMQNGGWVMVKTTIRTPRQHYPGMLTCVGFAKRAAGITHPWIWTPDDLYRKLRRDAPSKII